ncbi:MAG: glutamate--tRNA ligase family protein [Candidatus Limnocylindrales bacterium]
MVRGHVEIDVSNLGGDFVIVRNDGMPLYHFTVVVDDAAMEVTEVIRGEDHLSNTPKHILLFRALGYDVPRFAHLPLILNPDRSKMSKRKSQTAIGDYIAQGFIREALVNYLALLGWSTGSEDEVLLHRGDRRALRPRGGPQGRGRIRSRAARMAQRAMDPSTRRGRSGRSTASVRRGRTGRRSDRLDARRRRTAVARCRSSRSDCRRSAPWATWSASCGSDEVELDPVALVPKRWDIATTRDGPDRRTRDDHRGRATWPSRRTSWSRRCGRWPRRAAGRPATCSWPSASR